jgi:nitroimidazol reductase NimA-like FMN-containing flavoprotein (pyridoxamine 5'-phosphate oxidase superfamily)
MKSQSVIAWGEVEFIEDIKEKENILHIIMAQYTDKKFTYSVPALRNVKIWKIPIEKVSCKSFAEPHK